jgi:uncharacterized protein DUF4214
MRATNFQIRRLGLVLAALLLAAGIAPAATITCFIERSYEDLLARQPNRLELQMWTTFLQHRGSRAQLEATLTSSAEYKADLVNGWYQRFLHRPATAGEISSYQFLLLHGTTDKQVLGLLLGSDEYFNNAGGTNQGFVNQLFQDLLGRSPNAPESAALLGVLGQGAPRTQVVQLILGSQEYEGLEVQAIFLRFLHREPTAAESDFLRLWLQNGASEEAVIDHVMATDEYFNLGCRVAAGQ